MSDSHDTAEEEKQTEGKISSTSRRTIMQVIGLAGLIGLAGESVSATNTTTNSSSSTVAQADLHFGESYSDVPAGQQEALKLENTATSGFQFGVRGITNANKGRGLAGHARNSTGSSIGLLGRNKSKDGSALEGFADATSGSPVGVKGTSFAPKGKAVEGVNKASSGTAYGVLGRTSSNTGYGVYTPDDAKVDGTIEVGGDIQVSGVKNFVQTVSTDAGPKKVTYTAIESGDPQTETSNVVEMTEGVAVVDLPDHFGMVTSSEEPLSVQVTPYCNEKVHPQVTDQSTERIVVKDFSDGPTDYTFAYTVKGIRQGFEDQEVVSENW